MATVLTPQQALEQLQATRMAPGEAAAACLIVDARGEADLPDSLCKLLGETPEPVLVLADKPLPASLQGAADVVLDSERLLTPIVRNIEKTPIAAMSLVKLSRAIEHLPLESALDMESVTYGCLQGGAEYQRWLQSYQPEPAAPCGDEPPLLVHRDGDTLRLRLNRPELRNSITVAMRDALVEALSLALMDASIARVLLSGAGKCFSVGGELREFGSVPDTATGHWVRSLRLPGRWLARVADRCEARVHGACIGAGVELPAFAGRLVAAPDAYFQLPEIQFGLVPGAGGCISIARRTGRHRFNQMALSAKRITAETALDWGLVDAIMPD